MKIDALQELVRKAPPLQEAQLQQWLLQQLQKMGMDPGNLYQELEMSSRLVDTHLDVSHSHSHMQLHSHPFYELLFCRNSCGAEYLVDCRRYSLRDGDVILVPPGVSHRPLLPEQMPVPYERYVLWISQEFMEGFGQMAGEAFVDRLGAGLLRTAGSPWEGLRERFAAGVREARQGLPGWEAAVVGNTVVLLTELCRALDMPSTKLPMAEKPELLDKLAAYVEENYAQAISIGELSRRFFVSSSTVTHLFKQKMGVSFYRYVTQRRLIAAKSLIEKGMVLENVAMQTGFSDYSGFYRAFKQEYGISPRQYRHVQEGWARQKDQ